MNLKEKHTLYVISLRQSLHLKENIPTRKKKNLINIISVLLTLRVLIEPVRSTCCIDVYMTQEDKIYLWDV